MIFHVNVFELISLGLLLLFLLFIGAVLLIDKVDSWWRNRKRKKVK